MASRLWYVSFRWDRMAKNIQERIQKAKAIPIQTFSLFLLIYFSLLFLLFAFGFAAENLCKRLLWVKIGHWLRAIYPALSLSQFLFCYFSFSRILNCNAERNHWMWCKSCCKHCIVFLYPHFFFFSVFRTHVQGTLYSTLHVTVDEKFSRSFTIFHS